MAVLGPLGPPDIPQATPLPVAGKTLSQCSPRHFHSPRVQGLRRTSQSGACASPVLSRPPPHNPVTTPRRISPSSPPERGGGSPRDTQIKNKQVQGIQQSNANKYTSLSHQAPPCKYSSNGISERSSTGGEAGASGDAASGSDALSSKTGRLPSWQRHPFDRSDEEDDVLRRPRKRLLSRRRFSGARGVNNSMGSDSEFAPDDVATPSNSS